MTVAAARPAGQMHWTLSSSLGARRAVSTAGAPLLVQEPSPPASLLRAALPFLTGVLAGADRKAFWPSWKSDQGASLPRAVQEPPGSPNSKNCFFALSHVVPLWADALVFQKPRDPARDTGQPALRTRSLGEHTPGCLVSQGQGGRCPSPVPPLSPAHPVNNELCGCRWLGRCSVTAGITVVPPGPPAGARMVT